MDVQPLILPSPSRIRACIGRAIRAAARHVARVAVLLGLMGAATLPVRGQIVTGRLLDAERGSPVAGAFVTLQDSAGRSLAAVLGDPAGEFRVQAPGGGVYRVAVERLGYLTFVSEPFRVGARETVAMEFRLPEQAISLPGLEVAAAKQCRGRRELAEAAATIWEEVRKALEVSEWTRRSGQRLRYHITATVRELDPRTLAVRREELTARELTQDAAPYAAVAASILLEDGFIQPAPDGDWTYYAPDARVLLSDEFLDAHCFSAVTDRARPELVGLGFEPSRSRPVPGIRGVLWIRRSTWELSHIEFRYTALPWPVPTTNTGGHVGFTRLPDGRWIVSDWWLRAPVVVGHMDRRGQTVRYQIGHIHEIRREIDAAVAADRAPVPLRREREPGG